MKLEHPELAPFESTLKKLHDLVFQGGIEALQKARILGDPQDLLSVISQSDAANRRFIRGCHYGWELTQRRIAELVIEYETEVRRSRERLKENLRNRNRQEAEREHYLIFCLTSRQIVLRRLADTILYHMVKMQSWIPRHISLDYRIREIDPDTLARMVRTASELNREERLNFHLASDLTTVVHVGDLVRVKFSSKPAEWSLIELKEGKMNAVLSGLIEKAGGKLEEEHLQGIGEQYGAKAVSQARRMVRQESRRREFMQLVSTDEGMDIMHNVRTKFRPDVVHVRDYGETLRDLCIKARSSEIGVSIVDDCFRLVALNRKMCRLLGWEGIAHLLYHMQFDVAECTLKRDNTEELEKAKTIFPFFDLVQLNLRAMWPPPIFLWPVGDDLVFDFLFGRAFVFGQLDFDRLFETGRAQGIEMRWATDQEIGLPKIATVIPGSPNSKGVRVRFDGVADAEEQTLLTGFFARMFLEFMSPSQFLELVKAGFQAVRASWTEPRPGE